MSQKRTRQISSEINQLKILEEELSRRNLLNFVMHLMPEYEPDWHHKLIAKKLTDFAYGRIKRLIINVPPQHGKSTLSCRYLPSFLLGINPGAKIGLVSYSSDLANGFNRDVQQILDEPKYKNLFPKTQLPDTHKTGTVRNSHEFKLAQGGYVVSTGAGGALTGKSLDFGIIDDLYKNYEEANSPVVLQSRREWYQSTFLTRFSKDGKILMLFTRWNEDDVAGYVMEQEPDKWEQIIIPALATKRYLKRKAEGDPRTKEGDHLWDYKFDKEQYLSIQKQNPRMFSCLYQQDPAPTDGNILNPEWMRKSTLEDIKQNMLAARWDFFIDTAYTTKTQNDPSAIIATAEINGIMYVRNVATVRMELPDLIKYIEDWTKENGYSTRSKIYIEPKASGLSVVQAMRSQLPHLNVVEYRYPKIDGKTIYDRDKQTKAYSIAPKLEAGKVRLIEGNYIDHFLYEVGAFPNSSHDDQVDILIMAVLHYFLRPKKRYIKIRR